MKKLCNYVDPFIGVENGNCLCGPYLPNSLVRLGPDVVQGLKGNVTNGYRTNRPISRFTHTHVSGTGGGGRYGNIGLMPFVGIQRPEPGIFEREDEQARSSYYSVVLKPSHIRVELTSTPRVGVHRYTFPSTDTAHLLVDIGSVIQIAGGATPKILGEGTGGSIGGYAEVVSDTQIIGRGDYKGGWGHRYPYSVYFYLECDKKMSKTSVCTFNGMYEGHCVDGANSKVIVSFEAISQLNVKVGISYVSIAQARESVIRETGRETFETIQKKSEAVWENTFSAITVESTSNDDKTMFYSMFSRLMCMPSDLGIDDEFHLWKSGVRHFSDYYCLWDSVRNANSLITLFNPQREIDLLNCLLDIAEHRGWLPDAWIAGHSAQIQGGSSADILLCEAAINGLSGIDFKKALHYMRKNNEEISPNPQLYGRYLEGYRDQGYVPVGQPNAVSRHIEYSYQDWCISRLASLIGEKDIAEHYKISSQKVWNLWHDQLKCLAPKREDGTWAQPFNPFKPNARYSWLDPYFYEGTSVEWSLCVFHDMHNLIKRHGGTQAFEKHLDSFFNTPLLYRWKEFILHAPYLYHYVGRPDRSCDQAHQIVREKYSPTRNGLPDPEDMGAHSGFYMSTALGFYPIMGQGIYLLSTPFFESTHMRVGEEQRDLHIEAPGAGGEQRYISSVTFNGKRREKNWISYRELSQGGTLTIGLSKEPSSWGTIEIPPNMIANE